MDDQNKDDKMEVRAMVQAVSRRPLTAEARAWTQTSACGICGGQFLWDRFSQITSDLNATSRHFSLPIYSFIIAGTVWSY
jgi:formate dehydrogenase assembly factor FdhD